MADTRIYLIVDSADERTTRLIEASNASKAIRHVASRFKVSIPDTKRVAELVGAGVKVEKAVTQ